MISLAHPTLTDLSPPELVRAAASAGFDAVNFRVVGLNANAGAPNVFEDDAALRETAAELASSGVVLLDVEVIRIEADTRAADYRPLFEAGARLGARFAVAISMDASEARVTQRFGELCAEAEQFGIRMVLEFMMRGGIRTLGATHRIVTAAGHRSGILVDALHFYRSGATPSELAAIDPELFPYMQINDVASIEAARKAAPTDSVRKVMPGTGELPLTELLQALPTGIPISVEVHGGDGLHGAAAEAYARRAFETTRAVTGAADRAQGAARAARTIT